MSDSTSKDDELDDILNEFLIWHWEQFKTGKYEKLAHVPYSWKQQGKARESIKQYGIQERIDALEGITTTLGYDGEVTAINTIRVEMIRLTALTKSGDAK